MPATRGDDGDCGETEALATVRASQNLKIRSGVTSVYT